VSLLLVDHLVALYNVVLIAVWSPLAGTSAAARWMIAVHCIALSLPLLLARAPATRSPAVLALREIYPLLWVLAFWRELGIHCGLVGSTLNDVFIAGLDRTLFGVNLNVTWAPAVAIPWVGDLMQFLYFSYYALLALVIVPMLFSGDRAAVRDLTLRLSAAYLAAYVVYAIAPTAGPMAIFPRFEGPGTHGLFRLVNDALQAAGDAAGTAFPSTHVAGAVTLAWVAWRHRSRLEAWAALVLAVGIPPATVYTQNHLVIDAVAGALLGLGLQTVVLPLLTQAQAALSVPRLRPPLRPATEPEAA